MVKVAIITGASSGIGRASAIALSKQGWSIVLFARRVESLEETKALCTDPSKCLCIQGDVQNEEEVATLFRETLAHFGRLDLLFNNAGTGAPPIPLEELSMADVVRVVNVNLIGSFICTREAVKIFKSQTPQGGRIINNGSISAQVPRPHSAPYTASKHAITGLTKSTLLDGRRHNITCTQIDIGNAMTDIAVRLAQGALQADGRIVPETTFDAKHVGETVAHIAGLPLDVTILNTTVLATDIPFVGRG